MDDDLPSLKTTSIKALMESPNVQVEYLVEPLLPVGGSTVLGAEAGLGKSWLTLRLALDVAVGQSWLGCFPTKQGSVLIIDEENTIPLLKLRLEKLARADDGLLIKDLPIFFAVGQSLNLSDGDSVSRLHQTLRELRPRLVILDSLVRVHRANENSAGEMAQVFAELKRLTTRYKDLTFLFTHHTRKPGMMSFNGDPAHNLRGSGDIRAFVDTQLSLRKAEQGLVLSQDKARWSEPIKPINLRIADTPNGGVEVVHTGAAVVPPAPVNAADEFILDVLADGQVTRKGMLELAQADGIPERTLDWRLQVLCSQGKIQKLKRVAGETPYRLTEQAANPQEA